MTIPQHLPLTKKKRAAVKLENYSLPSLLSKWCVCQIQIRTSDREHGGNFLLLCYLKAKQLASHAKGIKWKITINSQWMLVLLKTHITLGQMVALCNVLHWGVRFTLQQGFFNGLRLTPSSTLALMEAASPAQTAQVCHLPSFPRHVPLASRGEGLSPSSYLYDPLWGSAHSPLNSPLCLVTWILGCFYVRVHW